MNIFNNIEILPVGVAVAAIGMLGFIVFFRNQKSLTNQSFLFFSLAAIAWNSVNFFAYQFSSPVVVLWLLRSVLFFAVGYTFLLFRFFYVFPNDNLIFPNWYKWFLRPVALLGAIISLTPIAIVKVNTVLATNTDGRDVTGIGMLFFGLIVVGLLIGGVFVFSKKMYKAQESERNLYRQILFGTGTTFSLYIILNFVFPVFFHQVRYIQLGALSTLPLIISVAYAIIRYKLFNIKIIATEFLAFGLSLALLFEMIVSDSTVVLVYRAGVFLLVLGIGILLIKSVRGEVKRREEVTKLAQSLEKANSRLKELDQLKTEFLSVASHQLRTPLSIIKGYTSLMEEGAYGKPTEEMLPILHNIDVSNERLIKLVDEFLNVSRIEQGRTQFHFAPVDMNALLDGIVTELQEKANTKKIVLNLKMPKNLSGIIADEDKIRHGIYNFVDNAIKYSPLSSQIEIFIESKSNKLWIHVVDQGVGLDGKDMANLFQKFYRSPHVIHDVEGNGLGLFVVRQFVEGHNGKVWAKSKGINKGSDFGFWIPTTLSASPSQPPSSIAAKATVKTDKS